MPITLNYIQEYIKKYVDDSIEITSDTSFEALDFDSLSVMELITFIERDFRIQLSFTQIEQLKTIADLLKFVNEEQRIQLLKPKN